MAKRTHALGANIGLAAGVITNILLWLAVEDIFWFWWNFIGAAITFTLGYGLSLVLPGKPKEVVIDFTVDPRWLFTREAKILMAFFVAIVLFSMYFKYMI